MKHLPQYILESIFNTDSNIKDEHGIEKNMFNDYDSPFWKYLEVLWNGDTTMSTYTWERIEKEIDVNKDIIWLPDLSVRLNTKENNPFANKYSLVCKDFYIGNIMASGPHAGPVADGGGFKDITCNYVQIDGMCEKLSGFKFIIDDSHSKTSSRNNKKVRIYWCDDLDYFDAEFKWVDNYNSVFAFNQVCDFPNLKNVKSNAERISMYDCSFFDYDEIKSKLDKFFGTGKLEGNGIIKNKSTRNIVAMANNIRKYGAVIPDQVIPEGKLSDLIDLRGFKDIQTVSMRSNNVCMTFCKPDNKDLITRHARFVRMNNMKLYKDSSVEDMVKLVKQCQTKDGWVLLIEPEQFG